MQKDIRESELYQDIEQYYKSLHQPGTGLVSDAAEINAASHGRTAVFSGTMMDGLEGAIPTRICEVELASGDTRVLTFGPNLDRSPKYSPCGQQIAFLSDRIQRGNFQLYLLDPATGAASATPQVDGWVEYFHWSPDGSRILLGVAGHGADVASGQGAVPSNSRGKPLPDWMPVVDNGSERHHWRHVWVYDLAANSVLQLQCPKTNIWEAVWCGVGAIAAVVSKGPSEALWYKSHLERISLAEGAGQVLFQPDDQIGWPAASPSGRYVAIVEAVCSDRTIVAGDLIVVDTVSGQVSKVPTLGVDITYTEWRSDHHLLLAGHRGFKTVVSLYDNESLEVTEIWQSAELSTVGRYATLSGFKTAGDCVMVSEGFTQAPCIAEICAGDYRTVKSINLSEPNLFDGLRPVEPVTWLADDGLEIQGWLLRPSGEGPYPLLMEVHGGPVWHWRPRWLARTPHMLTLAKRGYAVFWPNPRGSSGRGQHYARQVKGDWGGADAQDLLAGIDDLVRRRIADPARIGITGGSYGGFMTAWLCTQDSRFAAVAPVAPHTNQVSQHLTSNISYFDTLFLKDHYYNHGGRHIERSPVMYAHKAVTPTLNVCGALDRCTPPGQALEFHNALLENNVESVLITYPKEGHGVSKFPTLIDYNTRLINWFEKHMGAELSPS